MHTHRLGGVIAAFLATASLASAATAITSLPYTITASGQYYLASNLSYSTSSSAAIIVQADNVVLDFAGHSITSTASSADTGVRIYQHKFVTVKNGSLVGFTYGLAIPVETGGDSLHVFQNLHLASKTSSGSAGFVLHGVGHTLQNITATGLQAGILSTDGAIINGLILTATGTYQNGLHIYGSRNRITNSVISGFNYAVYIEGTATGNFIDHSLLISNTNTWSDGSGNVNGVYLSNLVANTSGLPSTVFGASTNSTNYPVVP